MSFSTNICLYITIILASSTTINGQGKRGVFFRQDIPTDDPLEFPAASPSNPTPFVTKETKRQISFFAEKYSELRIYRDGIIIFKGDEPVGNPGCPSQAPQNFNALAPFWLPTTGGSVTFVELVREDDENIELSATNFLRDEIQTSFSEEVALNDIEAVVLITWINTFHANNGQRQELKNTFQLAIITTRAGDSYSIYIYRRLDIGYVKNLGVAGGCAEGQAAVVTIGAITNDRKNRFFIDQHFPDAVKRFASFYTNIKDHRNLGRYIMKLKDGAQQPTPPTLRCVNNPDPICAAFNWFRSFQVDFVSKTFCLFRDAGIYAYPFTCNQFVQCGVGKDSFTLKTCQKGTTFNNQLGICDSQANFECQFSIGLFVTNMKNMTFVLPTPQKQIHENFCFLRQDGFFADKTDCSRFLKCHSSRGTIEKCPSGTFWKPSESGEGGRCDFPYNVDCGDRPLPPKTTPKPNVSICEKQGNGFFPDPDSCSAFLQCVPGRSNPFKLECPKGLYFSRLGMNKGYCNRPIKVCCKKGGDRKHCW
ncbi:uncharacterized protein [Clytia hemisphaerica]|uniref:Chitin-binding type-2 domain-containing protein n=1 Tax=Clytia hemisphaerica TaxID=252671 RepID=A0A7M5WXU8_9CNID